MGRHKKSALLIKEQEASYITRNIGITIPSPSLRTGLKTLKKRGFYSPSEIITLFKSKKMIRSGLLLNINPEIPQN